MTSPWYHESWYGALVLEKLPLFLVAAVFAVSATACSSLTRPDEIAIYAEPPPPPAIRQLPPMPAAGANAPAAPAPGGGG